MMSTIGNAEFIPYGAVDIALSPNTELLRRNMD